MRKLPLLLFTLITSTVLAQGWRPVGARASSLAGASVCLEDVWAYHHNPGALAGVKTISAGVYYEARFLLKELQTQAVAVTVPLKKGVLSFGGQFYGYEQYRHTRAGAGYALQLAEHFSAGIQLNMQQLRFNSNYGSATTATFEAGMLARISSKWKLGCSILNAGRQRLNGTDERLTTVLRIGSFWSPSEKVHILMEAEKQVIHPISFRAAAEYLPVPEFVIRIGTQSGPGEFAFGCGYRKSGFTLDAGSKYHPVLGWTPHVGLTYQSAHETH